MIKSECKAKVQAAVAALPFDVRARVKVEQDALLPSLLEAAKELKAQGKEESARALVCLVQDSVTDSDFDTHLDLYYAYVSGVGNFDATEKYRRAFEALKSAASISMHPNLLFSVALHYRDGLNDIEPDPEQAELWLRRAAEAGSEEAKVALGKRLIDSRGTK